MELEALRELLTQDVIKRDTLDGEKADSARKKVHRSSSKALRARKSEADEQEEVSSDDKSEVALSPKA